MGASTTAGVLLLSCFLTAACATPRHAVEETAAARAFAIDLHEWAAPLAEGDRVALVNTRGNLHIRAEGDNSVRYAGMIQKLDDETRAPEFHSEQHEGILRIAVAAPRDWNGRVDASARIPNGSPIELQTDQGLIEVMVDRNDVSARSGGGDLIVRTAGRVELKSESGNARVILTGNENQESDSRVESVQGDIEIWLQPGADLVLTAHGGNGVYLEPGFESAIAVLRPDEARLMLGTGAARLDALASRGSVRIRALPAVKTLARAAAAAESHSKEP